MKVCIVGNSHAAALRLALGADCRIGDVQFDFYVIPGGHGPGLCVAGNRLHPDPPNPAKLISTISGAQSGGLDLTDFDAVIFSAAGLGALRNSNGKVPRNRVALRSLPSAQSPDDQTVSEEAMVQFLEQSLHESANFRAIKQIRSVFAGPLIIQVCPLPSRALGTKLQVDGKQSYLALEYGEHLGSFLSWYFLHQIAVVERYAQSHSAMLVTPPRSFFETGFTPDEYAAQDSWHMNAAYGRLILDQSLARLCI